MSAPGSSATLLARQWQHGGWLSTLLLPLSALTAWAVARKRARYRDGRLPAYRAPVPVVVIGNVYVGGTGKTPMVIATVEGLRARGFNPGVVSRGYGAKIGPEPRVGHGAALAASAFGDEPALIARASGAPVSVHPKRALAAQALLRAHPDVDVIVSDDGLQHLALARDVEIVVQDERGIGNGRLLPAGPLREPASRLREVDAVVTNVGVPGPPEAAPAARPRQARMWLEPGDARQIEGGATRPLAAFAGRPGVAAAAGIGNPQRFFATLRGAGITPEPALALPDHHDYAQSPFRDWHAESILVTSKDAIKCAALHDARLWEVPVRARYSDPQLFEWLAQALRQLPARR